MIRVPDVRVFGVTLVLLSVGARTLTASTLLPWWTLNPAVTSAPETMLPPSQGFLLDALAWLGLALVMSARGVKPRWALLGLLTVGAIGVLLHGWWLAPLDARAGGASAVRGDLANASIGSAWAAALAGAVAIVHAASDRRYARTVLAVLVSLTMLVAIKGVFQITVEHPATVDAFDQAPAEFLHAQGIEPETPAAREFERRLRQPDPTGWFGHPNVFASFMGALALCAGGLAWSARRAGRASGGEAGLMALVGVLGAAMLAVTASKGAIGATVIVFGAAAMCDTLCKHLANGRTSPALALRAPNEVGARAARIATLVTLALCALPLLAVVVRGLIGEGWGERSLLFRWQYLQGSAEIAASHPLMGSGPGHFKDAFLHSRPALCPEEVESPHSVFVDLATRLGAPGLAWGALLIVLILGAGRTALGLRGETSVALDEPHRAWWLPWLIVTACAGFGAWTEHAALVADEIAVRAVGVLACGAVAWAIGRAGFTDGALSRSAAVAALMLAVHSQIEVTAVLPGSAALLAAFVGLGARTPEADAESTPKRDERASAKGLSAFNPPLSLPLVTLPALLVALALAVFVAAKVRPWEAPLRQAAQAAERARAATDRGGMIAALGEAGTLLGRAADLHPWGARDLYIRAASLHAGAADAAHKAGDTGAAVTHLFESLRLIELGVRLRPASAAVFAGGASLRRAMNESGVDPTGGDAAVALWTRAVALDPRGLEAPLNLALLLDERGDAQAAEWARRALDASDNLRLDPVQQADERTLALLRTIAR